VAAYTEILVEQGATFSTTVNVEDTVGTAINLFGYSASSQMRKSFYSASNTIITSTITGNEAGATRTIMRQFVKLYKGDIVTIRNYDSHSPNVITSKNAGGDLVGQNAMFMTFRVCPLPYEEMPPHPPTKPEKPHKNEYCEKDKDACEKDKEKECRPEKSHKSRK
jgi:hypothetical protein